MRATTDQYLRHLQALLPTGQAWAREDGSKLVQLLSAFAGTFARTHNRALDLVEEADPRTTLELLTDWERVCGLPDACSAGEATTVQVRRQSVVARLTGRGGQSRQFYIDLAAALGYAITITEFDQFVADDPCEEACHGDDWQFAWQVNGPEVTITEFRADVSVADEPLRAWGNARLECAINRAKPAHTLCIFAYGA